MEFKKFNSIENSYREKYLEQMRKEFLHGGEFVVEEKVHGANFSFWFDGEEFKCAKRSGFLSTDEMNSFNNATTVFNAHMERIRSLYASLKFLYPNLRVMTVYGELIGGSYPHPDVPRDTKATRIQKGVYYCPHNEFYGFDIVVDNIYLDETTKYEMFEQHGFLYSKPLFRGTLEECLVYPNTFQTRVPEALGLPEIDGNTCEGVIIRPVDTRFFQSRSRVILKNKNEKFSEKQKESDRSHVATEPMEGLVLEVFTKMCLFITENRLRNVLSHMGPVNKEDFGKIANAFNKDLIEDYNKEHDDLKLLEKKQSKRVTKDVTRLTAQLIRKHFLNILDGNF